MKSILVPDRSEYTALFNKELTLYFEKVEANKIKNSNFHISA